MAEQTGRDAASKASKTLRDESTGDQSKSAAASALSQTDAPGKETSERTASDASDVLRDGRTSSSSKSAAASTLTQKE